jgi:hypothetical protein
VGHGASVPHGDDTVRGAASPLRLSCSLAPAAHVLAHVLELRTFKRPGAISRHGPG